MARNIGFVILSHNHPRQLHRLTRTLQIVYDNPPIAVHHDFSQSPISTDEFASDVKFVSPHVRTRWAQFSVVDAILRALKQLYDNASPDWFFLLSGVDYPVVPATKVLNELSSSGVDALIDYREVPNFGEQGDSPEAENPAIRHYGTAYRAALAYRLYRGLNPWFPIIRKGLRIGRKTFYLSIRDWRAPFRSDFRCYFGDTWFGANAKAAEVLLKPTATHLQLQRYLRLRSSPTECYINTILANSPGLKLSKATRRFAVWCGADHPKNLESEDLPAIMQSNAYFARKFLPGAHALDEIDRLLGVPAPREK